MIERYALWDIDNCLSDDRWRAHLIDKSKVGDERYALYNESMIGDFVAHHDVFNAMCGIGCKPVFFTGRSELYRPQTQAWLHVKLGVDLAPLYMRPNGTVGLTPAVLKKRMLLEFMEQVPAGSIVAAFDDIPGVVQMYRSHGIPATVLAVTKDLSHIYEPAELETA